MVATIIAMVATLTWWPDPQAVCCQSSGPETPQQPIWGSGDGDDAGNGDGTGVGDGYGDDIGVGDADGGDGGFTQF